MTEGTRHFLSYRSPALLWGALIFVGSSIPAADLPKIAHLVNDKIIHATLYFILALLVYRALQPRNNQAGSRWIRLAITIAIIIVYGISDEFHQHFVPGRTVDVLDATADTAGGILAAILILIAAGRARGSSAANG